MRAFLALLLVLVAAAPAGAQSADFNEVEAELMCDTCNVPLNIAESTRADQQRAQIRRLIAEGRTKEEILDIFVAEYGPNVLADPQKAGGSPAVWAVPLAVLLAAVLGLLIVIPRWRRQRREASEPAPSAERLSDEDDERLRRDLALYDR